MKRAALLVLTLLMISVVTGGAFCLTKRQRAQAYYDQGYLYYTEHSYKRAIPEFVKALKYRPEMFQARYWMAKTYYKMGKYQAAFNQCSAALHIKPSDKYTKSLLARAESRLQTKPSSPALTKKPTSSSLIPAIVKAAVKIEAPVRSEHRISLDLRNVDISSVLEIFSKETGLSVIAGKDVYGKVTVLLNNVFPDEALDMILKSNGYTYSKTGNVIQVFSSGEPARVEELPGGLYVRTFMINYVGADELKDTLSKLMPEDTSIFTTKGSKTIVVKGTADDIKRADVLIRNLDIPPRQVMVEAKIIEVENDEGRNLGVNASYTNPDNPSEVAQTVGLASPPSATGAIGLYYSITNQNVSSLVQTLSTRAGFNVLSSPKVMAVNEQKAKIITGSELGYYVNTVTTTGLVQSVVFMDVGTMLEITPSIKSDGLIVMDIHPEVSDGSIVNGLPQKNSTETTTQLIVKDGQTIIIGGLVKDSQNKTVNGVPYLMDIPVIGSFFKSTTLTSTKKDVIVLISPHIVNTQYLGDIENQISDANKKRQETTPDMNLDLFR